jgi:hypothetical protein
VSNQTFLYSTAKPDKPLYGQCPEEGRLLMAALSIPVFWYMLYDEDSLRPGPEHDNPSRTYLHLTTPTAKGLARAGRRWPAVSRVLGRQHTPLFLTWVSFVRDHADAYLHCETAEWFWMFPTHQAFETSLCDCLQAFDNIPDRQGEDRKLNGWWDKLLSQAHVSTRNTAIWKNELVPLGNLSYCGFSYHYEVPWSEDHNVYCGVMSEKVCQARTFGGGPNDLHRYLKSVWGPVHATRLSKCLCGSREFRLRFVRGRAAQRICTRCSAEHYIGTSGDNWNRSKPAAWKCKGCRGDRANIGVGFGLDDVGEYVQYMHVAQRCVQCGLLDHAVSWEEFYDNRLFRMV